MYVHDRLLVVSRVLKSLKVRLGHDPDPGEITEETSLAESLRRLVERLPERERRIVALRYGIYDGRPRTLEEIGDEFNLTGERIGQLEQLALCRLRHPSFGAGPDL